MQILTTKLRYDGLFSVQDCPMFIQGFPMMAEESLLSGHTGGIWSCCVSFKNYHVNSTDVLKVSDSGDIGMTRNGSLPNCLTSQLYCCLSLHPRDPVYFLYFELEGTMPGGPHGGNVQSMKPSNGGGKIAKPKKLTPLEGTVQSRQFADTANSE